MKLRCIRSFDKLFLKDKIYEAKGTKIYKNKVFYNLKDENDKYGFVIPNGLYWEFEIVKENEMKELTLQQAFECEVGTKFDIIYLEGNKADVKAELYKGEFNENKFRWCNDEKEDLKLLPGFLNAKFIPIVEKEVSFMEAIKAYSEGNTIKNILDGNENIYKFEHSDYVEDKYGRGITQNEILEAKWYIID